MATHDYSLADQSGASFRSDLNLALEAIARNNDNSGAPATTFPFQWHVDTTSDATLKIRDGANNAYIQVGATGALQGSGIANLGLALAASPTFTGTATFGGNILMSGTGTIDIPVGTIAERPGAPNNGMIRYNTTLSQYEGYSGSAWGALGGGATGGGGDQWVVETDQTVTTDYTLTANKHGTTVSPTINSGVTVTVPSGAILVIL